MRKERKKKSSFYIYINDDLEKNEPIYRFQIFLTLSGVTSIYRFIVRRYIEVCTVEMRLVIHPEADVELLIEIEFLGCVQNG